VTTRKGERTTISLDSRGSRVTLEPNSTFVFVKPDDYQILKGTCSFFFKKLAQRANTPYRVRSGTATVTVRGTEFLTSVTKTKTVIQVLDGLVNVSNMKGTQSVDVSAGYQTTVTKTKLQPPKPFTERQRIIQP
jgi:ferric-dicitrate binding protein FerR (iron transport regulator)